MKTLLIVAAILVMFLVVGPIPADAQVTCDGALTLTIDRNGGFGFCWERNPEPDVQGYLVYKSRAVGVKGDEFLTFLHVDCGPDICETGKLQVPTNELGAHYFKVYAYDGVNVSGASNEVVLIVEDQPPSPPSGCSVKKFLP